MDIDKLCGAIMNLTCKMRDSDFASPTDRLNYKLGHKDARHAAVDLVMEFVAQESTQPSIDGAQISEAIEQYERSVEESIAAQDALAAAIANQQQSTVQPARITYAMRQLIEWAYDQGSRFGDEVTSEVWFYEAEESGSIAKRLPPQQPNKDTK